MKRRRAIKLIGASLIVFVFSLFFYGEDNLDINSFDESKIEDFDLILSKGQSLQSKLISFLKLSINDYSHIGILIKENGKLFVLHSTPDGTKANGIRYDDLQTFIELSNVSDCKILRYRDISKNSHWMLTAEIDNYKTSKKPFDFDFDNFNTEKIYCSELIWLILNKSGLIKQNIFDLKKPIYPKYFQEKDEFVSINYKKTAHNSIAKPKEMVEFF